MDAESEHIGTFQKDYVPERLHDAILIIACRFTFQTMIGPSPAY